MKTFPLTTHKPLLLASTSKYRRRIMDQLGLLYECAAPEYEEDHTISCNPEELVMTLAAGKARSLAQKWPNHLIIGCDQLGEYGGHILTKPGNFTKALEQLSQLNGYTHRLLTGLVVLDAASGVERHYLDIHRLTMRQLTTEQLTEYLQQDEPYDCAGSYKIESSGLGLFKNIEGNDFSAIIGLPALALLALLGEF